MSQNPPLVSCLMVTANRPNLVARAVACYRAQTYPNKELVVVDDGTQDLSTVLSPVPEAELKYIRLERKPDHVLGLLRNVALKAAEGSYLVQWDDDDWYHPERVARQAAFLESGYDACCLKGALMHLDTPEYFDHPYIGYLREGVPGTIMHRRDTDIRYPLLPRAEDSIYLREWRQRRFGLLPGAEAQLFIRCFHGANTWESTHFLTRLRNTPADALAYAWYRYVRGDLFRHPRFRLTAEQQQAFAQYRSDSERLGLFRSRTSA